MKKLKFFFSMRFAMILLVILASACVAGSVIRQGNPEAWYMENYSPRAAHAILLIGADDIFHSVWFVILTVILCVNLLGCNLIHIPVLIRRLRSGFRLENCLNSWDGKEWSVTENPERFFEKAGFRHPVRTQDEEGRVCLYAARFRAGIWGAWICHLGMLIVILGFALGQILKEEYTVYGVPGQTKPVGETRYALTIDSFAIDLREDDTVEQYTAALTLTDTVTRETRSGTACVNAPLSLFGMKLFQNSTGWAATLEILKDGKTIQENVVCAGEYVRVEEQPDLVITLAAFYPDYLPGEDGMPKSQSGRVKNPAYLYRLYYQDQVLGMNILTGDDRITVENYQFIFRDPQPYTLIQIKRDPYLPVAAAGGILLMAGIILAFYCRTSELWAVPGDSGLWRIAGRSRKAGLELEERVRKIGEEEAVDGQFTVSGDRK